MVVELVDREWEVGERCNEVNEKHTWGCIPKVLISKLVRSK